MKPANVFQLEVSAVFTSPRALFMKLGYAYLIGLPFALISMPVRVRMIGIVILILFTSFFGAATTLVARRSDGLIARIKLLPIPRSTLYADLILSGSAIDSLQVGVVILLLVLVNGKGVTLPEVLLVGGAFVLSVVLLNVIGMLLGAVSGNSQEVHLIGSIGVGVLGFLSGLYPVPGRLEGFIAATSKASPLYYLSKAVGLLLEEGGTYETWQVIVSSLLLVAFAGALLARAIDGPGRTTRRAGVARLEPSRHP